MENRKNRTALFLLFALLGSCDLDVRFEAPQPEGTRDESSIPKKLIGQYSGLGDSTSLDITRDLIIKKLISRLATTKMELDSSERTIYKSDTVFKISEFNIKMEVSVRGDSVFTLTDYRDTLFDRTQGDILRKFKGSYFLNHQISKGNWRVTRVAIIRNGITLGTVSKKEEIEKLREISETQYDTVYNFRPTKKQLTKFLHANGFSTQETYLKIK